MYRILGYDEPYVRCYQHYAFPTGILKAKLRHKEYIYNKFINIVYLSKEHTNIEFDLPYFMSVEGLFISGFVMFPSIYHNTKYITDYIKECIDSHIYVSGMWDEYYLPPKDAYMKYNFERNYLIYGYNDETEMFYSVGYLGANIWNKFQISYYDFNKSLLINSNKKHVCFNTYVFNTNFDKKIDVDSIYLDIENYLNSAPFMKNRNCSFGICGISDYFNNLGNNSNQNGGNISLHSLFALYEHKKLMKNRLLFMNGNKQICIDNSDTRNMEKIVEEYKSIISFAIKHNISKNVSIIEKIRNKGLNCVDIEENILNKCFRR